MSNTSGTPFDDGPELDLSVRDPFAEFLSESDIEVEMARPGRTSDELELFPPQDVAAQALGAGRSRSVGWPRVIGAAAVTAIVAGSLTSLMMRGRALPVGERLPQPDVTGAVSGVPSAPVVPYGAAAAVPVVEHVPSPTSSRVRVGKRSNTDNGPVVLSRVAATARATAVSAHPPSSGNEVEALAAPARASLLLAPLPSSVKADPTLPTPVAPADMRVTATASDSEGDELTFRWSAPVGRFANAMDRETVYTCPDTPATVAVTVTVTDGHGGIASDTLTIHCVERR